MANFVQGKFTVNALTSLAWLAAIGAIVSWGLPLLSTRIVKTPAVYAPATESIDPQAVARFLGADNTQAAQEINQAERFKLHGVVAGGTNAGAALISIDGSPARPFRVGSPVEDGLILRSVIGRQAVLSTQQGEIRLLTLEMPPIDK